MAIVAGAAAGLMLAGCVNFSALDDLKLAPPPTGLPFDKALVPELHVPGCTPSATSAKRAITRSTKRVDLADQDQKRYRGTRQRLRSQGAVCCPAARRPIQNRAATSPSHAMRDRLVRALTPGRDAFPRDAARAQADYDCWMLNAAVASQARAAAQCRASLDVTLPRLESEVQATAPKPTEPQHGNSDPRAGESATETPARQRPPRQRPGRNPRRRPPRPMSSPSPSIPRH